jgi:hypothetical protein
VVLAASVEDLSEENPSAGAAIGFLPQCPWGLFLTASTPLPRTVLIFEIIFSSEPQGVVEFLAMS